jgi:hypothetical protein
MELEEVANDVADAIVACKAKAPLVGRGFSEIASRYATFQHLYSNNPVKSSSRAEDDGVEP